MLLDGLKLGYIFHMNMDYLIYVSTANFKPCDNIKT